MQTFYWNGLPYDKHVGGKHSRHLPLCKRGFARHFVLLTTKKMLHQHKRSSSRQRQFFFLRPCRVWHLPLVRAQGAWNTSFCYYVYDTGHTQSFQQLHGCDDAITRGWARLRQCGFTMSPTSFSHVPSISLVATLRCGPAHLSVVPQSSKSSVVAHIAMVATRNGGITGIEWVAQVGISRTEHAQKQGRSAWRCRRPSRQHCVIIVHRRWNSTTHDDFHLCITIVVIIIIIIINVALISNHKIANKPKRKYYVQILTVNCKWRRTYEKWRTERQKQHCWNTYW